MNNMHNVITILNSRDPPGSYKITTKSNSRKAHDENYEKHLY